MKVEKELTAYSLGMRTYIGVKVINAYPLKENGKEGYCVHYPDGYISWSPKKIFEEAYREVSYSEKKLVDHQ